MLFSLSEEREKKRGLTVLNGKEKGKFYPREHVLVAHLRGKKRKGIRRATEKKSAPRN